MEYINWETMKQNGPAESHNMNNSEINSANQSLH